MTKTLRALGMVSALWMVSPGCDDGARPAKAARVTEHTKQAKSVVRRTEGVPPQPVATLPPEAAPAAPEVVDQGKAPSIKEIMTRAAKGPQSLTSMLRQGLRAESPAWGTIQPQAHELARLAVALSQNDPPRGSKDSWARLTLAYAESAQALDQAARAQDKAGALAAHGTLANSCIGCHREHRTGGRRGPRPGR